MLVNDVVVHRANQHEAIENPRAPREMFADLRSANRRIDRRIIGSRLLCLRIAELLGIPGVDLTCTAAQPYENAVLRLAKRRSAASVITRSRAVRRHRRGKRS